MNVTHDKTTTSIGILHLSDIHFSDKENVLENRWELLFRALKDDFLHCPSMYIVVSGDIANSGKESEYRVAREYFNKLVEHLKTRYDSMQYKFVFVPGNHDCNFDLDTQVRMNTIDGMTYETIGKDGSVFDICLQTQSHFWEFYGADNEMPDNKMYYRITDTVADYNVCFHCFNTAWMSKKDDSPGAIFFPVKRFSELVIKDKFNLNIAVLHHPLNWFNPKTSENNKTELQNLLDRASSLQLIGHEHANELRRTDNIDNKDSQSFFLSGDVLQKYDEPDLSGFQTLLVNVSTFEVRLKRYRWKNEMYQQFSANEITLNGRSTRIVKPSEKFMEKLNSMDIPLNFGEKQAKLTDIYVFPDLEPLFFKTTNEIDGYVDSETLFDNKQFKNCILEGDSQIGKTSLLYMLFLKSYERGLYPILLNGKDVNSNDSDKIIYQAFKSQYSDDPVSFERYKQIDTKLKVLLIDDLHASNLNKYAKQTIKTCFDLFGRTFITFDAAHSIIPEIQAEFKDVCSFTIKPLGYKKSDDLVERYVSLSETPSTESKQAHLDRTKNTFNQLRQILGDKLIPSYPIFVLSIIQALEYAPLKMDETSYGYCYHTLIHLALLKAGVSRDSIDSYINIITELAFHLFTAKTEDISEAGLEAFYSDYKQKFIGPGFETLKSNLIASKLLKQDSGSLYFGYKYILFFLAAKRIADMIERPEGKAIVKELYDNLHKEENANILVLITHHTKNLSFIDESMFTLMLPFENALPITLKQHCNYYKLLEDIVEEITQEILEMNDDPSQKRKKELLAQDRLESQKSQQEKEENDLNTNEKTAQFFRAFRSIEIVGQIIKNRKGSLEKTILKNMLVELYTAGFRMVSYLGDMIKEIKNELSVKIKEKTTQEDTSQEVERKVYKFLQFVSLQICLGVFSKIIDSAGVKELREVYAEVAETMNTPAAKIVSFSINTYYGKMNLKELEMLAKEFEGNFVALQILRARVKSYVYNNYVNYHEKQKIASILNMKVSPAIGRRNTGH